MPLTDSACTGYARLAMERAGFSEEDIQRVTCAMYMCFGEYTVEEAELAN